MSRVMSRKTNMVHRPRILRRIVAAESERSTGPAPGERTEPTLRLPDPRHPLSDRGLPAGLELVRATEDHDPARRARRAREEAAAYLAARRRHLRAQRRAG